MSSEPGRYVVNYGFQGIGQEWTPEMSEEDATELYDRLLQPPNVPDRVRLLRVVRSHDVAS